MIIFGRKRTPITKIWLTFQKWQKIDLSENQSPSFMKIPKNLPKEILAEDGSIGIRLVKDDFL